MPEHLRALAIIALLGGFSFWTLQGALSPLVTKAELRKWRNLWLAIVSTAFLSSNFWVFVITISVIIAAFVPRSPPQRVTYYLLLICALPSLSAEIPGVGGIRYLFEMSYPRLLTLLLLAPLLFNERRRLPQNLRLFRLPSDRYIVGFIILLSLLAFRDDTITNGLRKIAMLLVDIIVPYYALSRYLRTREEINVALAAILLGIVPIAYIGLFESLRHWHLYDEMGRSLLGHAISGYDVRAGVLRASAVFKSPIVLGYIMVIGFSLLLYLRSFVPKSKLLILTGGILLLSLLGSVSRGPWIGFVIFFLAYIWSGHQRLRQYTLAAVVIIMSFPLIMLTPYGKRFVDLLPIVGSTRTDTIEYRQKLAEISWKLFQRNPLLGSTHYRETPEMESMRQGQGIIDIVNSYINIALSHGMLGVLLFLLIFFSTASHLYNSTKNKPRRSERVVMLSRILFGIHIYILSVIATVSSIDYVPIFYWMIIGVSAAHISITREETSIKGSYAT